MLAFDDVFEELQTDLDRDAQDLNWIIIHGSSKQKPNSSPPPPSTSSTTENVHHSSTLSNMKLHDESLLLLDHIPDFLLASSSLFRFAYFSWINKVNSPVEPSKLEQLTILVYKMAMIQLRRELWQTYLDSGTGEIKVPEIARRRSPHLRLHAWPIELSLLIMTQQASQIQHIHEIDHETYLYFVKKHLAYLDEQYRQDRFQFHQIKMETEHYLNAIDDEIERFVQKRALLPAKLYFEARITLLTANYLDRFYQYEYHQQKPSLDQVILSGKTSQCMIHLRLHSLNVHSDLYSKTHV